MASGISPAIRRQAIGIRCSSSLPFIARAAHRRIERLRVEDVSPARTRAFLQDLEKTRRCGIATRNQRLAAIHSLARFIGLHSPEHLEWCRSDSDHRVEESRPPTDRVLGKGRIGCVAEDARPSHCPRSSGLRGSSVSVQHRCSGRRGGPGADRRPRPRCRIQPRFVVRCSAWQRKQDAVVVHCGRGWLTNCVLSLMVETHPSMSSSTVAANR